MQEMITYKFKSETKHGHIPITGDKIEVRALKKQIATKSGSKQEELVLDDEQTGQRFKDSDFVKSYSIVIVERVNPLNIYTPMPTTNISNPNQPVVQTNPQAMHELLETITDKARYFMIKSSNEDNIRIAKQKEIWATTFINQVIFQITQRKLKDAFDESQNVLLFFKANNSNNLQGLARMEDKPSDTPNKSVWAGVDTIKLGGNFRIKWLSRSIVAANRFENQINPLTREYVSRSGDVQEIERNLGKKMACLFDLPVESDLAVVSRPPVKSENFINIDEILKTSGPPRSKVQNGVPGTVVQPLMGMFQPPLPMPPQMFNHMYQMMYMNMVHQQGALAVDGKGKSKEMEKESKTKKDHQSSDDKSSGNESDSQSDSSSSPERKRQKKHKSKKSRKSDRKKDSKRKRSKRRDRSRSRDRRRSCDKNRKRR